MTLDWVAQQLESVGARSGLDLQVPRYNPRPAGVMREGGAAKDVLDLLTKNAGRWFTFNQILTGTGRTAKSLDWACIFLRSMGHVEFSKDDGRNSRYLRYRVPTKQGVST